MLEIVLGSVLAAALLGLAAYSARRQFQTLALLRVDSEMPAEDRRHHFQQVRRRLTCAALMSVFAFLIIGWFFIEAHIPSPDPADLQEGRGPPILQLAAYYWIAGFLILFALLATALLDFLATARFGLRQRRNLEKEHRAILEQEAARLRRDRNTGV